MFEGGLLRAIVASNVQEARKLAARELLAALRRSALACSRRGSTTAIRRRELPALSFKGKSAVLSTTNGTRALTAASAAPFVATAPPAQPPGDGAAAAVRGVEARAGHRGRVRGERTRRGVQPRGHSGRGCDRRGGTRGRRDGGADGRGLGGVPPVAVVSGRRDARVPGSSHGRAIAALGFEADLRFSAQLDVFESVPVLHHDREQLVLRTREPGRRRDGYAGLHLAVTEDDPLVRADLAQADGAAGVRTSAWHR